MMQKLMSYKKIIVCACAAAAVIVVAAVVLLSKKEETFRSILVYDVQGSAVIERASVGTMDAVENLYLESGDRVSVASDSGLRMKLDDDKYVMAEANTVFSVEADGTEADSRTKICLEQGAITNEIQNPLREGSHYETSTPNSVMAVRGTIYRVELCKDKDSDKENQTTKLCCFQGNVGTKPILPDGTYGEEVMVPAGSELSVYQDGTVGEVKDIVYEELPIQAIQNLVKLMENGQSITGISLEELKRLVDGTEDAGDVSERGTEPRQQPEEEQTEQSETAEAAAENAADQEEDAQIHTGTDTAKNGTAKQAKKERAEASQPAVSSPLPAKKAEPANGGSGNSDSNGGGSNQDQPSKPDQPGKPNKPGKPDKPDKPDQPEAYTVTFMYQGKVFATQTVKSGETAAAPVLLPAADGAWDFDFGTKIQADTTVTWK